MVIEMKPQDLLRAGVPRFWLVIGLVIGSGLAAGAQQDGLMAHDLSGFTLDMTVEQVTSVANRALTPTGTGQYQVMIDGIDYSFGFSAAGHLYRIDSRQQLFPFPLDAAFAADLTHRLTKKFGQPLSNQLPAGPVVWMYQETYAGAKGEKLTRETESLTVLVAGGTTEPVTVEMQMIAPRIERRDAQTAPGTAK